MFKSKKYICAILGLLALGCSLVCAVEIEEGTLKKPGRNKVVLVGKVSLKNPIDCGSLDEKPCDLIFLIATPDDGKSHMNLLKNLSLMLSEPGFANKLRNAGSAEEITKRLIACEKNLFSYS